MNATRWNLAMFSALLALVVVSIPFLAIAQDIDFGGFSDIDFGGFSDIDFGGSSDIDFGGMSGIDFGGFGTGPTATSSTSTSGQPPAFDPFDGDLGPFGPTPGIPPGTDTPPTPGTPPTTPPPGPGPTPPPVPPPGNPSSGSRDALGIFINQIIVDPFELGTENMVPVYISFENEGNKDLEDTRVIVVIPDLGVYASVGPLDLDVGETVTKVLLLEIPEDADLNQYPIMFQIQPDTPNADDRIVFRELDIIDYS